MAEDIKRDKDGQIIPGQGSLNPGGRPRLIREALEEFRNSDDLRALRLRLLEIAKGEGKVAVSAIKEYHDRAFGRAPQAITGPDGGPVQVADLSRLTVPQLEELERLRKAALGE